MWRGGVDASQIDVPAMWAAEEALTDKQRRHRYRCRDRYRTIRDMHPWTFTMVSDFPEIHKVAPAPVEEPKPEATNPTEAPSESTATPAPAETQTQSSSTSEVTQEAPSTQEAIEQVTDATAKLSVEEEKKTEDPAASPFVDSDSDSEEEEVKEVRSRPKIVYSPNAALNRKVCVYQGDITSLEIDAIVNAANRSLLGGGGVDGAIHSAAGNTLYTECLTLNGANTGETKITRGYNLPAKYVLHTVGPIGQIPEKLESCYQTCLDLVEKHNLKTVAFCGVSTGIYGYPRDKAAHVALRTVRNWLEQNHDKVDRIIFVNFLDAEQRVYLETIREYFPPAYDPEYFNEYAALVEQWSNEPREPISDTESDESEPEADPASDSDDSDDNIVPAVQIEANQPEAPPAPEDTPQMVPQVVEEDSK